MPISTNAKSLKNPNRANSFKSFSPRSIGISFSPPPPDELDKLDEEFSQDH